MHISKIEIENYRNFKRLLLEDLPATVVFIGENGIGKSNLLCALRLVLDPALPDSARMLRREDFWDGLGDSHTDAEIRVTVEITGFDKDVGAKAILADSIVKMAPLVARLTYLFRPAKALPGTSAKKARQDYEFIIFGGDDEKTRVGSDVRRHVSIRVLPVLRDAETDLQTWSKTPLRPLLERLDLPEDELSKIAEEIEAAASKLVDGPAIKGLNKTIVKRLQEMVGKLFSVETKLGVAATMPDQLLRSVRLLTAGVHDRPITEVSLGTASLIYLVLLLEHLEQQQRAGEVVTTFLAVEEPEAHLHPGLQRLVFRHLLRLSMPLMLTSHSTHIASVTPLMSLVTLKHSAEDGTLGYTASEADLSEQEVMDVERYLDVDRAEMLVARGVILVEGPAELFLIPPFAAAMGVDLESFGIVVCSVHGTDFAPYRKLLGVAGLAIPHVIITDGDPDSSDATVIPAGITRAKKLLTDTDDDLESHIEVGAFAEARKCLRKNSCFVGKWTLEVDLLPSAQEALKTTYNELQPSELSQQRFAEVVDKAVSHDSAACLKMLARIERVGKGRFAQRLVDNLDNVDVPFYIKKAIERIIELVKANANIE
jgi:putative ATP-dependent endonuclease of OLD family